MVERHRPEPANMLAICQLILVHQPEWSGECFAKGDAACSQSFSQSFGQKLQHIAAPGQPLPAFGLLAGGKNLGLPLGKVLFNSSAEMLRSQGTVLLHAGDIKQGQCQLGGSGSGCSASP